MLSSRRRARLRSRALPSAFDVDRRPHADHRLTSLPQVAVATVVVVGQGQRRPIARTLSSLSPTLTLGCRPPPPPGSGPRRRCPARRPRLTPSSSFSSKFAAGNPRRRRSCVFPWCNFLHRFRAPPRRLPFVAPPSSTSPDVGRRGWQ
jgi:hypothetical protein